MTIEGGAVLCTSIRIYDRLAQMVSITSSIIKYGIKPSCTEQQGNYQVTCNTESDDILILHVLVLVSTSLCESCNHLNSKDQKHDAVYHVYTQGCILYIEPILVVYQQCHKQQSVVNRRMSHNTYIYHV